MIRVLQFLKLYNSSTNIKKNDITGCLLPVIFLTLPFPTS